MKITLSTRRLSNELSALQSASLKSAPDYRGNILFLVDGDTLTLHTSDGEKELTSALTDFEQEGEAFSALLSLKKIMSLVKQAPMDSQVSFKQTTGSNFAMTFSGMRARYTLASMDTTVFPIMSLDKDDAVYASMEPAEFVRALEFVSPSMAEGDVRYYLNGMHFKGDTESGIATLTATDGHRLAQAPLNVSPFGKRTAANFELIIPKKSVDSLLGIIKKANDTVVCGMTNSHLFVSVGGMVYKTSVIDGRFPDAQRVIPKGHPKKVETNRVSWLSAMNRVSILANEKFRGARLTFRADEIGIDSNNQDNEEGSDVVDAQGYGGKTETEIGFKVDYVVDALSSLNGETVNVEINTPNDSALMYSQEDPRFICVIMPMRL
jgi:DNA polymerase III subunit beta